MRDDKIRNENRSAPLWHLGFVIVICTAPISHVIVYSALQQRLLA
jgi:hypothetical protein